MLLESGPWRPGPKSGFSWPCHLQHITPLLRAVSLLTQAVSCEFSAAQVASFALWKAALAASLPAQPFCLKRRPVGQTMRSCRHSASDSRLTFPAWRSHWKNTSASGRAVHSQAAFISVMIGLGMPGSRWEPRTLMVAGSLPPAAAPGLSLPFKLIHVSLSLFLFLWCMPLTVSFCVLSFCFLFLPSLFWNLIPSIACRNTSAHPS